MTSAMPTGISLIRSFQEIEEFALDNGLKLLLFRDPSQANITVNITYLVGSRHEGLGEAGMAHLLEHMLFRGTSKTRDIKGALQDKGAQFNATTWFDRTNYFETLTPTQENLDFALALEADRMVNSTILQEDLDAEMTVVRNEFEMGENNPTHVLHDQILSSAYRWHNYGKSTIGNRSDIERVKVANLRKFYAQYYQPDNAVLIIAGQFERQGALELVKKYFGLLKKPERALLGTYTEEPAQDGPRAVCLKRAGDVASVALAYHIPEATNLDHAAVRVLISSLCDEPGGILYKNLVEEKKCSEVFPMVYSLKEPGMAMVFVRPNEIAQAEWVSQKLISLLEQPLDNIISDSQVQRIKKRILKGFKLASANSKDLALKLSESIACGDWRLFFWYKQQVEQVSLKDVISVHKKYIIESNRTSGVFMPDSNPIRVHIPAQSLAKEQLDKLVEDSSFGPGEEFISSVDNIESRISRKQLDWCKIGVLAKKTRGQSVRAVINARYGKAQDLLAVKTELGFLPAMLWRGTKKHDYQKLRDRWDELMSTLELDGHAGYLSGSIKSDRENIIPALSLLGEMLTQPEFKKQEFELVRQREIDDYQEIQQDPQRVAFLEIERAKNPYSPDHILYVSNFAERIVSLKNLDLNKIIKAYENLVATTNLCVSMVGDIGEMAKSEILNSSFNKKSEISYERIQREHIKNIPGDKVYNCSDKEMCFITWAANFPMRDDDADFAGLKLLNYIFGENMNSRLMMRIREKEGYSYNVGSWLEVSRHDPVASINMYAMAAPKNVTKVKQALTEEWRKLAEAGIKDSELKTAKESILSSFKNLLASDAYISSALAGDLVVSRDFFWRQKLFDNISQLSSGDLAKIFNKWLVNLEFSCVVAGDINKIK